MSDRKQFEKALEEEGEKLIKSAQFRLTVDLIQDESGKHYFVATLDTLKEDGCTRDEKACWFVTNTTKEHTVEELARYIKEALELCLEEHFMDELERLEKKNSG